MIFNILKKIENLEKAHQILSNQIKQIKEDRHSEISSLLQEKENFKYTIEKIQKEHFEEREALKNVEFFNIYSFSEKFSSFWKRRMKL